MITIPFYLGGQKNAELAIARKNWAEEKFGIRVLFGWRLIDDGKRGRYWMVLDFTDECDAMVFRLVTGI